MNAKNRNKGALTQLSAEFNYDEVEVEADWRYHLVVPYIRHSTSYLTVRDKYRGEKVKKSGLPKDEAAVYKVAEWFDILSVEADDDGGDQTDWWERAGKSLYGFDMPIPAVSGIYMEAGETRTLHKGGRLVPTFLIEVPLNLTLTEAQKGIKDLLKFYMQHWKPPIQFGAPLPEAYKAHFKLEKSKLQEETLINGLEALSMYKAGTPLWKIANELGLSPAHRIDEEAVKPGKHDSEYKRVLSIKARQLVKIASLVAENAARGRFPSKKMFPEAMLESYERDAGRPKGSKSPKTMNVTKYKTKFNSF
ncbi:hypothetical protein ICN30_11390 [Polynucleobacter sp. 31A-FELB]|uniref:hypothetical protein n=1 Tax=Polynucleobacter sp. 31A-FELB TaxID=2689096 RepID=UPI001C0B67CF|nr:hypothetical protein [Polynucleobacter sp. 31A-FELB]MBU3588439.1 hypothetical protein [Polynucleobacter sp. 31A-FELB]